MCTKCRGQLGNIVLGRRKPGAKAWGGGNNPPSWGTVKDSLRPKGGEAREIRLGGGHGIDQGTLLLRSFYLLL